MNKKVYLFMFITLTLNSVSLAQEKQTNYNSILTEVSKMVQENYIFEDIGKRVANTITSYRKAEKYDNLSAEEFAKALRKDLVKAGNDKHFNVLHTPSLEVSTKEERLSKVFSDTDPNTNYGFNEVKILKGNIGYIKSSVFGEVEASKEALAAAMNFVRNTGALIVDLRHHIGGHGETTLLFCSYFFKEKTLVSKAYFRFDDSSFESWTKDQVAGEKYLDRPVYLLVGPRTISASEAMVYNLQQYGLATIVGEKTYGAANPVQGFKIGDFDLFIPVGTETNEKSGTNWEHSGIQPDVSSSSALETAQILALRNLKKDNEKSELSVLEIDKRIKKLQLEKKNNQ